MELKISDYPNPYFQRTLTAAINPKKVISQNIIGPEAPRNLNPNASNSIGPAVALRVRTIQSTETPDNGTAIVR